MKSVVEQLLADALVQLHQEGTLDGDYRDKIHVERTRQKAHGDFASNIALMLAKLAKMPPRVLAEQVVAALPEHASITKTELAGPGFINFFVAEDVQQALVVDVLQQGEQFGRCALGKGQRVNVEFVSANPTGPLHVGHGRGAIYGSVLSNVLEAAGYEVDREYYVNDAGRQMDILAASVWLRYLALCGIELIFPSNAYQGDYVIDIAKTVLAHFQRQLVHPVEAVMADVPADAPEGDKEAHIDGIIQNAKHLLGDAYQHVHQQALNSVLGDIQEDLAEFHIHYQNWFSERRLVTSGAIDAALARLEQGGWLYQKEGATWFKSSELGDDKDRVLVRDNGQTTYFASDAAYLLDKLGRGYQRIYYVLGADHHGYVPRLKALFRAFGEDESRLFVPLVQFAVLYRHGKQVQMSTRSGSFVTLRELREEVGSDVARFFYVMRKVEQHLDFDLDLAKSSSQDNPVYTIQYAHARICSIFRQIKEKNLDYNQDEALAQLALLNTEQDEALIRKLSSYPELIAQAATKSEPHLLTYYLRELAHGFHTYYNVNQFAIEEAPLRYARLALAAAVRQVLQNGLAIMGISAPEVM